MGIRNPLLSGVRIRRAKGVLDWIRSRCLAAGRTSAFSADRQESGASGIRRKILIESIHAQLSAWGRWVHSPIKAAVGYPSHSAGFGDYTPASVEYKSRIPQGFGCSDDMASINEAVLALCKEDRMLCAEYYVIGPRWDAVCARLAMSKSVLYRELHRVQEIISSRMCDGI